MRKLTTTIILCLYLALSTVAFAEATSGESMETVSAAPSTPAAAEPTLASIKEELQMNINIVWTCVAAFLVFFMQAGFAMVETGFTRPRTRSTS